MQVIDFLSRLERVFGYSPRWRAVCPSCGGKRQKLSIAEGADGRILVRCFGGCSVEQIVGALGLDLGNLFPERSPKSPHDRGQRRPFDAGAALAALHDDLLVLAHRLIDPAADQVDLQLLMQRVAGRCAAAAEAST